MTDAMKSSNAEEITLRQYVELLFKEAALPKGSLGHNPINGHMFVWGEDPLEPQKRRARDARRAQENFARNGPPDAPPLPLSNLKRHEFGRRGGLAQMVAWYDRSLERNHYNFNTHPSFDDYARGVLEAFERGQWISVDERPEFVATLKDRFPPCQLPGLGKGLIWYPPAKFARLLKAKSPLVYERPN